MLVKEGEKKKVVQGIETSHQGLDDRDVTCWKISGQPKRSRSMWGLSQRVGVLAGDWLK